MLAPCSAYSGAHLQAHCTPPSASRSCYRICCCGSPRPATHATSRYTRGGSRVQFTMSAGRLQHLIFYLFITWRPYLCFKGPWSWHIVPVGHLVHLRWKRDRSKSMTTHVFYIYLQILYKLYFIPIYIYIGTTQMIRWQRKPTAAREMGKPNKEKKHLFWKKIWHECFVVNW